MEWNDVQREPWEVQPYGDHGKEFSLSIERLDTGEFLCICLSNQDDAYESIDFYNPGEIDDVINHLQQARKWLESNKQGG